MGYSKVYRTVKRARAPSPVPAGIARDRRHQKRFTATDGKVEINAGVESAKSIFFGVDGVGDRAILRFTGE